MPTLLILTILASSGQASMLLSTTGVGLAPEVAYNAETTSQSLLWADTRNVSTHNVWVTAYSSTPEETDDTPFITASGGKVRDGVIAANFLPFGTRVKIPALFGDKVFIVEDRMHPRKAGFVDVWMPTKASAKRFGITRAEIAVLK